jgi:hypothetical protein
MIDHRSRVPTLEDHVVCAPLQQWLAAWLGARAPTAACGSASIGGATPPRALRSLLPDDDGGGGLLDALVIVSLLHRDLDTTPLARLRAGGGLVDLALVRRAGWTDLLRPWAFAGDCSRRAVERVRAWSDAGIYDVEQFVALSPVDAIVTLGRRRV